MDRDKVTELLKNYRSYRYAVRMFETTGWVGVSGTQYSDMPRSSNFGSRAPAKFGCSFEDVLDYGRYKAAVDAIEGALDTLTEDERSVIRLKWMEDMTLEMIAGRRECSRDTIKRIHRRALNKLAICLRFVDVPHIERIPLPVA